MSNSKGLDCDDFFKPNEILFLCKKKKNIKNWTENNDTLLLSLAEKYNYRSWNKIAEYFEGKTGIQCSARYRRIKPEIKKGAWTTEEDKTLMELIKIHGNKWCKISEKMKNRTGKQIRDRFYNVLDMNINKEKFSYDEDKKVLRLYTKLGPNWTHMSKHLPGRTSQQIKNRFYGVICCDLFNKRQLSQCQNTQLNTNISIDINDSFLNDNHSLNKDNKISDFDCQLLTDDENFSQKKTQIFESVIHDLSQSNFETAKESSSDNLFINFIKKKNLTINLSSVIKKDSEPFHAKIPRKPSEDSIIEKKFNFFHSHETTSPLIPAFYNKLINSLMEKNPDFSNYFLNSSILDEYSFFNLPDSNQASFNFEFDKKTNNIKSYNENSTKDIQTDHFFN